MASFDGGYTGNGLDFGAYRSPVTQYGYGTTPGSSNRGYFEQQTPVGSFAAADYTRTGAASQAVNPYIGNSSSLGAMSSGQATAGANPYFGQSNPYTAQAVNAASEAAARNYNLAIAPQRDAQMARSGSFGNAGILQMQMEDQRNLQGTLGNIANNAYMQDLQAQQAMGESAANRNTQNSQFNVGARAGDLNRQLNAGQFDANLAQGLNMFNAGQSNQMDMFNAGQSNNMNMFNAGQGNNFLQWAGNMDYNIDQSNWNRQRQGNQDMLSAFTTLSGLNQLGIGNATNLNGADLNQWQQIASIINGIGGNGGTNTQNLQGNQLLSLLGGALAGGNMWGNYFGGGN